ncbi:DUF421 domain-containing protein [Bacillus tianshenii]|nr:DUF421 domain-containing protein [Bacillus tianshenii]
MIYDYFLSPLLIFIGGYIILRIAGKKAVSEMNSFDLMFLLLIGNNLTQALYVNKTWTGLYYGLAFSIFYICFALLTLNNKLRWLLVPSPIVLVRDGDIDEAALRKVRVNTEELIGTLREKGYTNIRDIELAVMEDMGKVSVIPKAHARSLQPSDLNLQPAPTFIPIPLIMNGEILEHNMKYLNKNHDWLQTQLQNFGLNMQQISDITLASYNQHGFLDIDTDRHHLPKSPYMYKPGNLN